MREAFEAWAQRDGHITRRREDRPDEYLVYETQRRWLIWQAALAHGQAAAEVKAASSKLVAKPAPKAKTVDEESVRNRVLNEVLAAVSRVEGAGDIAKVIESLKQQNALAE